MEKNNDLVKGLANDGIDYLLSDKLIKNANKQREKRILAEKFIQNLEVTPLMVILNAPDTAYKQYLAVKLDPKL